MDRHQVVHELYLAHAADLVVQVYGLTGDYGEAQDVVHEAYARALTASAGFDELDNPRAWRISQRLREAVVLHYLVDLPVDEVASILGITASAVRSRLQRGRQDLAVLLRDRPPAMPNERPELRDDQPRVEEFRHA